MTARKIPMQMKPDTSKNMDDLDDFIQRHRQKEKDLIPIRINKNTIVLRNKHK